MIIRIIMIRMTTVMISIHNADEDESSVTVRLPSLARGRRTSARVQFDPFSMVDTSLFKRSGKHGMTIPATRDKLPMVNTVGLGKPKH